MSRKTRAVVASMVAMLFIAVLFLSPVGAQAQQKNAGTQDTLKTEITEKAPGESRTEGADEPKEVKKIEGDPMETAESTNLFTTVRQGGPLMIFIILLGLVSMTIIIERLIFYTRNRVWKKEQLDEILKAARETSVAKFREDLEDDLRNHFQVFANSLERGLALLSGVGNLAPIVGFLGTVIGMISAFAAIAAATTVNAKVVAVGIQVALVTTAGGLIVAAPTLFFYYVFTNAIQNLYTRSEEYIASIADGMPRLSDKIVNGNHSS